MADLNISFSKEREENSPFDPTLVDKDAFSQIYYDNVRQLMNYASRFTQDQGIIEDVIQEIFFDLWQNREKLRGIRSLRGYLFTVARGNVLKKLRNGKIIYNSSLLDFRYDFEVSVENEMVFTQDNLELSHKLNKAIEALPALQKEVVYLKYYGDLPVEEICTLLKTNKKSVYNALAKAMKRFRDILVMLAILLLSC